ncbi:MAG: TonB-dependent receptor [Sphingobium sp.]
MMSRFMFSTALVCGTLASPLFTQSALAQTSGNDGADIVVTASKRGNQTILNTPISISGVGEDAMARRGAVEVNDLVKLVPGLSLSDQGPGNKRYVIRGIQSGGAGTVGVYLDEVVITGENSNNGGGLQADPGLYDIARVEVLKGPQGTTFGSAALSGVVRYIVNKPDLAKQEINGRAAATQQWRAGVGGNTDLTVNIPLIEDKLAVRASGFYLNKPGYISNRYGDDANKQETMSGRLQLRAKLADSLTLDLMFQHNFTRAGLNYFNETDINLNPVPRYLQTTVEQQGFKDDMSIYNATLTYDTGVGAVTATASHTWRHTVLDRPGSQVLAASAHEAAETPNTRSVQSHRRYNKVTALELRFASDWGGDVGLLAGVYYQKDSRRFQSIIPTVDDHGYIDGYSGRYGAILQDSRLNTEITEKAVFGEVTWAITDRLELIAGGRVFRAENVAIPNIVTGLLGATGTGIGPTARLEDTSAIGRGILSYKLADKTKVYAQVAQGYRAGGANNQAAAALGGATVPAGFKSDKLVSYELGLKHQSADRRFSITAAGFYVDWSDIQLTLRTPVNAQGTQYSYTGNAGRARVYGGEVEANVRPVSGVDLGVSASYTNSTVRDTIARAFTAGDRVPYTPKWQVTGTGDYNFTLGGHDAFVGADVAWIGNRVSDFPVNPLTYLVLPSYWTVNTRAGIDFDHFRVGLTARNLLNDDTVIDQFWNQPPQAINGLFRNPPRTVSLEFAFKM